MIIPNTDFVSTEVAGIKALKVRVNVTAHEHFSGTYCAGRFWEEGVSEAVVEGDPEATGVPQIDEHTNRVLNVYTLEQKLTQLYVLEGRERMHESPRSPAWKKWSAPGFALPDTSGKDPTKQSKPIRAKRLIKLEILEIQRESGKWETPPSKDAAPATKPKATGSRAVSE
jgi:hypothetical protein